jgi:hypothetical protein
VALATPKSVCPWWWWRRRRRRRVKAESGGGGGGGGGGACKPSAKCRWGMQVDASALFVGAGVGVSGPERERRKEETRMR